MVHTEQVAIEIRLLELWFFDYERAEGRRPSKASWRRFRQGVLDKAVVKGTSIDLATALARASTTRKH